MKILSKGFDSSGTTNVIVEESGARYRRTASEVIQWATECFYAGCIVWDELYPFPNLLEREFLRITAPEPAAPAATKTVKVRIAVAVDQDGDWGAKGGAGFSDEYSVSSVMCGGEAIQIYWLTAELPVPSPAEIPAAVSPS